jgi:hypothetical protein
MEPTGRFRIHRVLLGVLVGLAVLTAAGYGLMRYESAQYRHRADSLVARYKSAYKFCVHTGAVASVCATQAVTACTTDLFWTRGGPFSDLLGGDGSARCRDVS